MIEAQLNYLMGALEAMERRGATRIEVRRDAFDAYNQHVQDRLGQTVWNTGGCASWYIDRTAATARLPSPPAAPAEQESPKSTPARALGDISAGEALI